MSQPDPRKLCVVRVPLHARRPPCSIPPSWQQPQSTPALAEAHAAGGSAHSQLHCQHRYRYSQQAYRSSSVAQAPAQRGPPPGKLARRVTGALALGNSPPPWFAAPAGPAGPALWSPSRPRPLFQARAPALIHPLSSLSRAAFTAGQIQRLSDLSAGHRNNTSRLHKPPFLPSATPNLPRPLPGRYVSTRTPIAPLFASLAPV
ncbi:hypothetical protein TGAM01_v203300 [Trichoderma gamsii]|uniref:Uncharacterized protein n=1 Tax=Trichoderma gamsii TaxID=398673 RepID=A0A2P4ZTG1_9HYPO|nr:hypothetical protein TGAM01_v203300 [Trichoderma gamsii]PON27533.1 hypothetical protein TGAM01_v203300 [Trichoderma gamsii]